MFSELVDSIIARSGRPDRKADIVAHLNSTIRECQTQALFYKDLLEDQITLANPPANPTIWTYPRNYRILKAVQYPECVFPKHIKPSRLTRGEISYYYFASTYAAFFGVPNCNTNTQQYINLAYYTKLPRLTYFPLGARPAVWDDVTQLWTYYTPPGYTVVTVDPDISAADYLLVSNWLLDGYRDCIEEGTLAKIFKDLGDATRTQSSFAQYSAQKNDIKQNELCEALDSGFVDN